MIIRTIEEKIRINIAVCLGGLALAGIISAIALVHSYGVLRKSAESIYVLEGGVPYRASRTSEHVNRGVEYRSQVELFHRLFFTLAPDEAYIKENIEKSLYLIDDSGKKEYTNLREKGFYNQLISSSAMGTLMADSILVDEKTSSFRYFGKQTIERKTSTILRQLSTEGKFRDIARSRNNPHGVLLLNWRILNNEEISVTPKYAY